MWQKWTTQLRHSDLQFKTSLFWQHQSLKLLQLSKLRLVQRQWQGRLDLCHYWHQWHVSILSHVHHRIHEQKRVSTHLAQSLFRHTTSCLRGCLTAWKTYTLRSTNQHQRDREVRHKAFHQWAFWTTRLQSVCRQWTCWHEWKRMTQSSKQALLGHVFQVWNTNTQSQLLDRQNLRSTQLQLRVQHHKLLQQTWQMWQHQRRQVPKRLCESFYRWHFRHFHVRHERQYRMLSIWKIRRGTKADMWRRWQRHTRQTSEQRQALAKTVGYWEKKVRFEQWQSHVVQVLWQEQLVLQEELVSSVERNLVFRQHFFNTR